VSRSGGAITQLTQTPDIGETRLPMWPLKGGALAFTGRHNGAFRIFVEGAGRIYRMISGGDVAAYAPSWSPNGDRIAFQASGGELHGIVTTRPGGTDARPGVPGGGLL